MIQYNDTKDIDINKLRGFYCEYATWKVTNSLCDWNTIIDNTTCIITAYDNNDIIACVRALSDGVRWATIVDVLVHPNYRGQGLGNEIIKRLLDKDKMKVRTTYLATPDKEEFYNKLGFKTVNQHCSYMIKTNLENDENYFLPIN